MPQQPVFVVVSGGVVQDCPNFVEVIDFDNILPDLYQKGDAWGGWTDLSQAAREYIETAYPDEYAEIQGKIMKDSGHKICETCDRHPCRCAVHAETD